MFVKICGITIASDAHAAVDFGASAVGFIFWPGSPRFISAADAAAIAKGLPKEVAKVGVFVNQASGDVLRIVREAELSHVQLHGSETPGFAAELNLPVIKATTLQAGSANPEEWPEEMTWLVDAHDPTRHGGTGTAADWSAAALLAQRRRVLLAGGLNAGNIGRAISIVRPFGIDVSSGVESRPGVKDREKLAALFAELRKAGEVQ
jgi:phosphoribosylanthranilate isomerase